MKKGKRFSCRRDSLVIRGKIFGDTGAVKPVVILCHGFLANQRMCRDYAKLLADLGYISVTFDFCGGGIVSGSDGKSADMTVLTEQKDLLSVMNYLEQQPYTKGISLLGCSQGGLVSAMTAKKYSDRIEKLILMYPALCIPDDARKGKMMFYRFDPENIPDILGRFPMKLGRDYARTVINMNVFDEIGSFAGPVLYLHGTKDKIVDISYARRAHRLYPDCNYHELIGGGHVFKGKSEKTARRILADFMSEP